MLIDNYTHTFYARDPEFRVNPYPKHYGQSRRVTLVRTQENGETKHKVVFAHQCLDWGKVRVYQIENDTEFYRLLNKLARKTSNRDFGFHPVDRWMDRTDWQYDFWLERYSHANIFPGCYCYAQTIT